MKIFFQCKCIGRKFLRRMFVFLSSLHICRVRIFHSPLLFALPTFLILRARSPHLPQDWPGLDARSLGEVSWGSRPITLSCRKGVTKLMPPTSAQGCGPLWETMFPSCCYTVVPLPGVLSTLPVVCTPSLGSSSSAPHPHRL